MVATQNKIAILFGAGAVENAWQPILDIFRAINGDETDSDTANFMFAKSICALRLYSKSPKSVKQLQEETETVNMLKDIICDFLKQAQASGVLKPRKEFRAILDKFVLSKPDNLFGFVSTNWDTVIDTDADHWVKEKYFDIPKASVFHIHGSIEDPKNMYLPSETSMENYRTDEENDEIGYKHAKAYDFFKEANTIILYGISLDPLDAELSLFLHGAFKQSNKLTEIIIINPDFQKIRKRVKLLLFAKTGITIRCFHPNNLEEDL